ncbi:MAG: hypothetical protein ACKORG_08415 [Actinomycetota bacterium]|jgi:predicted lipid-binding transport protein (Tim44 family)
MGLGDRVREKRADGRRFRIIGLGMLIGLAWGTIMWAITGAQGGATVWFYLALTMAMIGGGVAAIFGAMNARKRGERISPRVMPKDSDEKKAEAKAAKAERRAQAKAEADARKQSG